ncbi:hypothetical protein VOLCADRAFT_86225 [Volvox carteri f. nagariensis]|uniref:SCP domain-containing protein n=1 Tax=Volvox carteri f. nagariensis TaxID=3068 RepID=D8TI81_VOLCA|nr:uncharacterized protein VOLCADRAFT_86225 [Volvox carteri f. nagariensis]EFJ53190.1 hypothetical protein VOLCADRAFT_86225 [Volvox carteri f. nagariensis]|eukprot:XP_002946195.1 hypothetical protein VOLCADRAFT_86225 [Volvox carteri f. nagariensis]
MRTPQRIQMMESPSKATSILIGEADGHASIMVNINYIRQRPPHAIHTPHQAITTSASDTAIVTITTATATAAAAEVAAPAQTVSPPSELAQRPLATKATVPPSKPPPPPSALASTMQQTANLRSPPPPQAVQFPPTPRRPLLFQTQASLPLPALAPDRRSPPALPPPPPARRLPAPLQPPEPLPPPPVRRSPPLSPPPSPSPTPPPPPPEMFPCPTRFQLDGWMDGGKCNDTEAVLEKTNLYRVRHQSRPMVWSETLAASAQAYAEYLAQRECVLQHSMSNYFGENLMMVWRSSFQMGCGVAIGDIEIDMNSRLYQGSCKMVVCRFQPVGNFATDNQFLWNVRPNVSEIII